MMTALPARGSRSRDDSIAVLAVGLFLVIIVWIVFGQTIRHGFINYDDGMYVYQNPDVLAGLTPKGIRWALTFAEIGHWHPVTWFSHMLDASIWGRRAGGHHLTSVLLHMASAVLLFAALKQMTGSLWRSAAVAASFAIHPQRVESVAWIAERKDVLSGLFFMLTILAYLRYTARPGLRTVCDSCDLLCARTYVQGYASHSATSPATLGLLAARPFQG